ncbi:MAG: hypothetical protein EXR75_04685 [Myxococcales bacterium]|nr:hypothetical protein [Myxococcales bacterium]
MRPLKLVSFLIPLALALAGCSDGESVATAGGDAPDSQGLSFETPEFEVPPGDSFECFYTDTYTDREIAVWAAEGLQGPGGHHILAYYTEQFREPQHHPCKDSEMVSWHQLAGSSGDDAGEPVIELKEGMAIRVPKGVQLVLQAHYINTTGAAYTVKDQVTLKLREPSEVSDYVNYFVTNDDTFEIPPQSKHTNVSYCTIEQDIDVVLSLGHLHESGKHFKFEILDDAGNVAKTVRDDAWAPLMTSHPNTDYYPRSAPLALTKGMKVRQTCTWENTTTDALLFPREMCIGFFYYAPGQGDLHCSMSKEP